MSDDFDDSDGDDFEDVPDGLVCPFCGNDGDGCEHFLGGKDSIFSGSFSVDEGGPLGEFTEVFQELDEAVSAFLAVAGVMKKRVSVLKPNRLRHLVGAISEAACWQGDAAERDSSVGRGAFGEYLREALRDTGARVRFTSFEENSGPGLSSVVHLYWSADAAAASKGLERRVRRDTKYLVELARSRA